MTQLKQIYKCGICGNIIEVLHTGAGELVCCGQPMDLKQEKIEDEGLEKHVPVIEKTETGARVKIGSMPHPMEESHFIEWVELISENGSMRKFLNPGDLPEVKFELKGDNFSARIYCNVHGLWKNE